ncbi:hypothetical protein QFZ38_001741 [Pseudomonas cedrina]|uniref:hypothetical protein n=1 Tax=Pseudomonas cedrina TaxID=651740 RepID=UPI002782107A|nr:hypothetical protein [Pseudomonas cedrina]
MNTRFVMPAQIPCGSGGATIRLARESGVSGNIIIGYEIAFASKPAPTLTSFVSGECHG